MIISLVVFFVMQSLYTMLFPLSLLVSYITESGSVFPRAGIITLQKKAKNIKRVWVQAGNSKNVETAKKLLKALSDTDKTEVLITCDQSRSVLTVESLSSENLFVSYSPIDYWLSSVLAMTFIHPDTFVVLGENTPVMMAFIARLFGANIILVNTINDAKRMTWYEYMVAPLLYLFADVIYTAEPDSITPLISKYKIKNLADSLLSSSEIEAIVADVLE